MCYTNSLQQASTQCFFTHSRILHVHVHVLWNSYTYVYMLIAVFCMHYTCVCMSYTCITLESSSLTHHVYTVLCVSHVTQLQSICCVYRMGNLTSPTDSFTSKGLFTLCTSLSIAALWSRCASFLHHVSHLYICSCSVLVCTCIVYSVGSSYWESNFSNCLLSMCCVE